MLLRRSVAALFTAGPQFLAFGAAQRVPDPLDYEGPRTETPLSAGVLAHVGCSVRCKLLPTRLKGGAR